MDDDNKAPKGPLKFTKRELKALRKSEMVLSENNEYGGITVQYSFPLTHRLYKDGNT
jgi:hypothetical protein